MKARAVRALLALFMALWLLIPAGPAMAQEDIKTLFPAERHMRALLIGCDYFVSQPDTWPAADHNVRLLSDTFLSDERGYSLIRSYSSAIATIRDFEEAVSIAFAGAGKEDVSLLYISTHGVLEEGSASLLLSDGYTEERLEAGKLREILDRVPGQKVVIVDACNSGALIGKGLSEGAQGHLFMGDQYKFLCSAGGSEQSWYWQGTEDAVSSGASYFAAVLADGLGSGGNHGADANMDGLITLKEAYGFLMANYAASTPQVYPQNDQDFVLYAYDPEKMYPQKKAVTDITFDDTLLTAGESEMTFSFTVHWQTELFYQIVYFRDGAWQFEEAQHYLDGEQLDGTVLPGRKKRVLSLRTGEEDAFGYAMIQLITREEGKPVFQGGRLLCVRPAEGEVKLEAMTAPSFNPSLEEELSILALHDVPCGLSVTIRDQDEKTIRRLSYEAPTRPQQLSPPASTYYWDGRKNNGDMADPGFYTVQVQARIGENTFTAISAPFELLPMDGAEESQSWGENGDN